MKKRTESSLVTAILQYLQCLENNGKILWCDRLNSGRVFIPNATQSSGIGSRRNAKRSGRSIRLCRPGTPDIYVILKGGGMLWIECKVEGGKLSLYQQSYKVMVDVCTTHFYLVARELQDLVEFFADQTVKTSFPAWDERTK